MLSPWIENYRGDWESRRGFGIRIEPVDELTAVVDILRNGAPIKRPWCANSPAEKLNALYREEDGLGLEVSLGRDGFAIFLDYEAPGSVHDDDCLTVGISRLEDDDQADQWMPLFDLATFFRKQ